jgi:hypothetical protein
MQNAIKYACLLGLLSAFTAGAFGQSSLKKAAKHKTHTIQDYINAGQWNQLFPHRFLNQATHSKQSNEMYSFASFLLAAKKYPDFVANSNDTLNIRELCAFLANIAQETSGGWEEAPGGYYTWGLYFTEEQNCQNGCPQYTDTGNKNYPPMSNCSYHGRGPKQLSWNYNYGQFSQDYFNNKDSLLRHPEIVSHDAIVAFSSALWFWMKPQKPKPSCHDIMTGNWIPTHADSLNNRLPGFGATINVINGGLECNGNQNTHTQYRLGYYLYFCNYFHVSPGENSNCMNQKPFNVQ